MSILYNISFPTIIIEVIIDYGRIETSLTLSDEVLRRIILKNVMVTPYL